MSLTLETLKNKHIIVTGAGKGIGKDLVATLCK